MRRFRFHGPFVFFEDPTMGKMTEKRGLRQAEWELRRVRELAELAKSDLQAFSREWSKHLAWRTGIARRTATSLSAGSAFCQAALAADELRECGQGAVEQEGHDTQVVMHQEACRSVAIAVDPRLCRLNQKLVARSRRAESKSGR